MNIYKLKILCLHPDIIPRYLIKCGMLTSNTWHHLHLLFLDTEKIERLLFDQDLYSKDENSHLLFVRVYEY